MNFLPGWFPGGAAARGVPDLSFLGPLIDDNTAQTTYTFTGVPIGAVDGTRRVVVVFHWNVTNALRTFVTGTIGGVAATLHVQASTGPTGAQTDQGTLIMSALVPSGTTATVVVTMSAACLRSSIAVYRAINEAAPPFHAVMTDITLAAGVLTGTLNIPAVGMLIAGSTVAKTGATGTTWVGVTEQYDADHSGSAGMLRTGGFAQNLALETPRTVSSTTTGTTVRGALVAMSWA